MREKEADELFTFAVNEGRNNPSKALLPIWGPDDSFHINPMLLGKIIKSSYFQKCCRDITDWNTLVDEVYYQVKNLEPWTVELLFFGFPNEDEKIKTCDSVKLLSGVYYTSL